jgi:hypothetical protein
MNSPRSGERRRSAEARKRRKRQTTKAARPRRAPRKRPVTAVGRSTSFSFAWGERRRLVLMEKR